MGPHAANKRRPINHQGRDRLEAQPCRAVLFDLDDTLYDSRHASRMGLAAVREQFPTLRRIPLDDLDSLHQGLMDAVHVHVLQGTLSLEEARERRFLHLLNACEAQGLIPECANLTRIYREGYQANRRAMPGAIPLLNLLRESVSIGIVTNNIAAEQRAKARHCGLEPLIDEFVISEEVGVTKPDPAIFHFALRRLGVTASEAIMVGDSWSVDVLGAQSAGIRAVWLNRHSLAVQDDMPVEWIRSLEPTEQIAQLLLAQIL